MFCSDDCKAERRRSTCENCNKSFLPSKNAIGRFCSVFCRADFHSPMYSIKEHTNGYNLIRVPEGTPGSRRDGTRVGRWMPEHRYLMQQSLGRPLRPTEDVHHKNGFTRDNRIENLSLKPQYHGRGQDVDDLVSWAEEILARYGTREAGP